MKKLIIVILLLTDLGVFSQPLTPPENDRAHRRYWYYKTRFINDFTKIGKEQGDCIIFAERNVDSPSDARQTDGKNRRNFLALDRT